MGKDTLSVSKKVVFRGERLTHRPRLCVEAPASLENLSVALKKLAKPSTSTSGVSDVRRIFVE